MAITYVDDHFNDGDLDPAWNITLFTTGWTYLETGTLLEVQDIQADLGKWGEVHVTQTFPSLGDFEVDFEFCCDEQQNDEPIQIIEVILRDTEGRGFLSAGYNDSWSHDPGWLHAEVPGGSWHTGYQFITNKVSIKITRVSDTVNVFVDGVNRVSGPHDVPLNQIVMYFAHFNFNSTPFFYGVSRLGQSARHSRPRTRHPRPSRRGFGGIAWLRVEKEAVLSSRQEVKR
jgi:hypothetical protein